MTRSSEAIIIPMQHTVRAIFEREQQHGPSKHVANESVVYEVWIDYDALHAMARQAAANKHGSAKAGPLRVKVTKRTRTPQA